ncbi:MAG TPA: phosphate ABC transporter, permease protein PstA, partial [Halanaerobiales bacterium]|nr:phosphate ABC transporter, permease protein PstA [Halanaerobiales bacterium]
MRDTDINLEKRHSKQKYVFALLGITLLLVLFILGIIIYFVFARGISVINWEFLTAMPKNGMTEGGIFPSIVGTFYLV